MDLELAIAGNSNILILSKMWQKSSTGILSIGEPDRTGDGSHLQLIIICKTPHLHMQMNLCMPSGAGNMSQTQRPKRQMAIFSHMLIGLPLVIYYDMFSGAE